MDLKPIFSSLGTRWFDLPPKSTWCALFSREKVLRCHYFCYNVQLNVKQDWIKFSLQPSSSRLIEYSGQMPKKTYSKFVLSQKLDFLSYHYQILIGRQLKPPYCWVCQEKVLALRQINFIAKYELYRKWVKSVSSKVILTDLIVLGNWNGSVISSVLRKLIKSKSFI